MNKEKLAGILGIINTYGLPLMEKGAEATKNPYDNYIVALLKGGLPEVQKTIEAEESAPTNAPAK